MGAHYSICAAKPKPSEDVATVKQERQAVIPERDQPVDQVLPYEKPRTLDDQIAELIGQGAISPATADHRAGPQPIVPRPGALQRMFDARGQRDESLRRQLRHQGRRSG
ncbi:MAG: hypothetical protein HYY13_00705 [Nitrospirae bacterium]|nr:hypothetical protein [Nitrospirota bacterium]